MQVFNKLLFGIGALILLGWTGVRAQDVFVDLQLLQPDAQIFNVGDFDFLEAGTAQNYFVIELVNRGADCRIKLDMRVNFEGRTIVSGESNIFTLPHTNNSTEPDNPIVFFSTQLLTGTAVIPQNNEFVDLKLSNIDYDQVEDLEATILRTGFLPAGIYEFLLKAIKTDTGEEISDSEPNHTLEITNPTSLEPLFPGRSASEPDLVEVATTFPYFQWYSDANPNSARYNIFVYEKFSEDRTVQDVLNHPPVLQIEGYAQNFFQYPTDPNPMLLSGHTVGPVRLLESGKTYYWLVESIIPTATSPINLQSDVFRFKVADVAQGGSLAPQILTFLRQVLGQNYEDVLERLLEEGFEPNGVIRMDGNTVQSSELLNLLNQILQGKMKLSKVESF